MLTADELDAMRAAQASALPETTTITRPAFDTDGYGGATRTWDTVAEDVPCRFAASTGTETADQGRVTSRRTWTVTVPDGTDLQVGDQVTGPGGLTLDVVAVATRGAWTTAIQATAEEAS
jgi:hypothetical protein